MKSENCQPWSKYAHIQSSRLLSTGKISPSIVILYICRFCHLFVQVCSAPMTFTSGQCNPTCTQDVGNYKVFSTPSPYASASNLGFTKSPFVQFSHTDVRHGCLPTKSGVKLNGVHKQDGDTHHRTYQSINYILRLQLYRQMILNIKYTYEGGGKFFRNCIKNGFSQIFNR